MKINQIGPTNVNPYKRQIEKQESISKARQTADKIEISYQAKELQKTNTIEVQRQEKVEQLKEKVQSGEYQINPKEIAKKMYEFWGNEI